MRIPLFYTKQLVVYKIVNLFKIKSCWNLSKLYITGVWKWCFENIYYDMILVNFKRIIKDLIKIVNMNRLTYISKPKQKMNKLHQTNRKFLYYNLNHIGAKPPIAMMWWEWNHPDSFNDILALSVNVQNAKSLDLSMREKSKALKTINWFWLAYYWLWEKNSYIRSFFLNAFNFFCFFLLS